MNEKTMTESTKSQNTKEKPSPQSPLSKTGPGKGEAPAGVEKSGIGEELDPKDLGRGI